MTTFSDFAPFLLLGIFLTALALAVTFYLLSRMWRRNAYFWRDLAQQREWECRQWREKNDALHRLHKALARRIEGFDPGKGEKP